MYAFPMARIHGNSTVSSLGALRAYLDYVAETTGLEVCFNDFTGHLRSDPEFNRLFDPFLIHRNPHCMAIKSTRALWDLCLEKKRALMEKCGRECAPYYGMCYAGREEYVFPVIVDSFAAGCLTAGGFGRNAGLSLRRVERTALANALDPAGLAAARADAAKRRDPELAPLERLFGIAVEFLSMHYERLMRNRGGLFLEREANASRQAYLLAHAAEYLRQRFTEQVNGEELASFCHCSVSTLSHLFRGFFGKSVREYVNGVRLERARDLLLTTDLPVTTIAFDVGFRDSNYFSRVFTRAQGVSPRAFRGWRSPQPPGIPGIRAAG
jgi:AraC-like DNA-binding protein